MPLASMWNQLIFRSAVSVVLTTAVTDTMAGTPALKGDEFGVTNWANVVRITNWSVITNHYPLFSTNSLIPGINSRAISTVGSRAAEGIEWGIEDDGWKLGIRLINSAYLDGGPLEIEAILQNNSENDRFRYTDGNDHYMEVHVMNPARESFLLDQPLVDRRSHSMRVVGQLMPKQRESHYPMRYLVRDWPGSAGEYLIQANAHVPQGRVKAPSGITTQEERFIQSGVLILRVPETGINAAKLKQTSLKGWIAGGLWYTPAPPTPAPMQRSQKVRPIRTSAVGLSADVRAAVAPSVPAGLLIPTTDGITDRKSDRWFLTAVLVTAFTLLLFILLRARRRAAKTS